MNKNRQNYTDKDLDKAFLDALGKAMTEELPEIPAEYSDRIDSALKNAMGSEKGKETDKAGVQPAKWRMRALAVCGAAAVAASIWWGLRIVFTPVTTGVSTPTQLAELPRQSFSRSETEKPEVTVQKSEVTAKAEPKEKPSRKYRGIIKRNQAANSTPLFDTDSEAAESEPCNLPADEYPEALASAHYRVVTSEEEANAIISSVFGRMESTVAEEGYRITEAMYTYESETDKLVER